jgi:HEAT repeat protein/energy-coupling factor transporter ATP-binding protein EcfA2
METSEKLHMLQELSEKVLTKKFLIPLYESKTMECKNVQYTHKKLEFGKDVIYYKEDEYGRRIYTAVQVKRTRITTKDNDTIFRQISEAFGEQFNDSSDNKKKNIDKFVVLTSNEFLEDAKQSLSASLRGSHMDRDVTCIDGNQLVNLLEKHLPSAFWDEYDYCNRYFNAMKTDFERIKDFSAIGQKEPVPLENIYVSLKLIEQELHKELEIFQEKESDLPRETQKQIEEEKISRAKIFDTERVVKDYDKIIILGVPGSGKTTLLRHLALKNCKENLAKREQTCVPIPITLQKFSDSGKDLREYIDLVFEEYQFPKAKEFVDKDLKAGKCKLLLDGFDELATKEKQDKITKHIHKFIKKYPKNQVIVTSRIAGYHDELKAFTKLELMEFDDKQIEQFVENWFGKINIEKVKSMLNAIKENGQIRALARNPLMISIIAIIYEEDRKLPQRRVALYNRCVEVLLSKWDIQKKLKNLYPAEKKEFILKKLAFYAHSNNKKTITEKEILEEMQKHFSRIKLKSEDAKPFLGEIWQRSYLLRQISRDNYDFLHLSFQEYFTALELKEQEDALSTVIKYLDDSWWEEPILLYVGITKDATALINRVKKEVPDDIFYSNLLLFGQCIADADFTDPLLREEIINELWNLYQTAEFSYLRKRAEKILGNLKPENIIELLIKDIKNPDKKVQRNAVEGLIEIGSEKAIEPLIEVIITSEEEMLKHSAAQALANIGREKAIEPLIKILTTSRNKDVNFAVAFALGNIGSEKAIEPLIKILTTSRNKDVNFAAAFALGNIGSEKAIEPLIKILTTSRNKDDKFAVAFALGNIGNEKAIELLIESLDSKKVTYQLQGAIILGRLGDERAVKPLIDLLITSKEQVIRFISSFSLSEIGIEKTIEPLIEVLATSKNYKAKLNVLEAFRFMGSEKAIEPLIEAFNTTKGKKLRVSIIQTIGNVGNERSIEFLTRTLTRYKDKNIQLNAAYALGKLGDKRAIKPLIEALITAEDADIQLNAAYALGKSGDKRAIKPLIEALSKDKEARVRLAAATSLGLIGDEKTIEPLKNALKDEGKHIGNKVKDEAFVSLKNISSRINKRIL